MKNYPVEFYFHKPVSIVNTFTPLETPSTAMASTPTYDAQFFPEGGHLLEGVNNKIGFRIIDRSGKGIAFK